MIVPKLRETAAYDETSDFRISEAKQNKLSSQSPAFTAATASTVSGIFLFGCKKQLLLFVRNTFQYKLFQMITSFVGCLLFAVIVSTYDLDLPAGNILTGTVAEPLL